MSGPECPECGEEYVYGVHNVTVEFELAPGDDDGDGPEFRVATYTVTGEPHDGPIMAACRNCDWADEPSWIGGGSDADDVMNQVIDAVNEYHRPRMVIQ